MARSISLAACAAVVAALLLSSSPAGAAQLHAARMTLARHGVARPALPFSTHGLTLGRIFEAPTNVVSFSGGSGADASIGGSVFGFALSTPQIDVQMPTTPAIFAATATQGGAAAAGSAAQALGLQLSIGSAQATAGFESTNPGFGTGPFVSDAVSSPAVFAFYNFPQAQPRVGQDEAFGFSRSSGALAATLNTVPQPASAGTSSLSSPLISALSPQGPFWYNAITPATRGSSLSLTIPFSVAKIPVKLHVGEQATAGVQSSSLATQILGPALASAGNYSAVTGGVTLALPLLSRRATVSLDGWYETLQRGDKTPFSLAPYAAQTPVTGAAAPGAVVYTPSGTDIQRYVGAASVALPVTSHLTVNGSFSEQLAGGVALDTLTQSLSQHKTAYGGGVAYKFPNANSSIEFFSNKNVYTDDNVPTYNFTESRQNLYFSVKF